MQQDRNSSFGFLWFLFREGSSLIFAGLVWYAVWGGYTPRIDAPEQAFGEAIAIGTIALVYLGLQSIAVVTQPLGRETRYLLDLMLSLVPLALIGYALAQYLSGQLPLSTFQMAVLWLGGIACALDVVIYTWFSMKLNKLASDFVQMR